MTGGANVPALNDLLAPYGIAFGDTILHGPLTLAGHTFQFMHGAPIARFPAGGHLHTSALTNTASKASASAAVFGTTRHGSGSVTVLGDANCLDGSHNRGDCYDFLVKLLDHVTGAAPSEALTPATALLAAAHAPPDGWRQPQRPAGVNFTEFSYVLRHPLACGANTAACQRERACGAPSSAYSRLASLGADWLRAFSELGEPAPAAEAPFSPGGTPVPAVGRPLLGHWRSSPLGRSPWSAASPWLVAPLAGSAALLLGGILYRRAAGGAAGLGGFPGSLGSPGGPASAASGLLTATSARVAALLRPQRVGAAAV